MSKETNEQKFARLEKELKMLKRDMEREDLERIETLKSRGFYVPIQDGIVLKDIWQFSYYHITNNIKEWEYYSKDIASESDLFSEEPIFRMGDRVVLIQVPDAQSIEISEDASNLFWYKKIDGADYYEIICNSPFGDEKPNIEHPSPFVRAFGKLILEEND